jgi:hypothetical protein
MFEYLNTVCNKNSRHAWYHEVAHHLRVTDLFDVEEQIIMQILCVMYHRVVWSEPWLLIFAPFAKAAGCGPLHITTVLLST